MKNTNIKRYLTAGMALAVALALTACGGKAAVNSEPCASSEISPAEIESEAGTVSETGSGVSSEPANPTGSEPAAGTAKNSGTAKKTTAAVQNKTDDTGKKQTGAADGKTETETKTESKTAGTADPKLAEILKGFKPGWTDSYDHGEWDWQYDHKITEKYEYLLAYYINQYRIADGVPPCEILPRFTLVARARSEQLVEKFEHNDIKFDEVTKAFEYGKFVNMAEEFPGYCTETDNYYSADCNEACGLCNVPYKPETDEDIDKLARRSAKACYDSKGHWEYVGSPEYKYMAVGATFTYYDWIIRDEIIVGSKNYG